MQFRVLGPVEIHSDDGRVLTLPRRQERCLLAILLLNAGRGVSMDRLCELLWEDPPDQAHQAVRTYVARIRGVLNQAGAHRDGVTLAAEHRGYLLRVAPELVDVHRFRALLDQAARATDPAEREELLRDALGLWHGPALDKAATDRLRQRLCADLDELHQHAVEEALAAGLDLGRHRDLLPELTRLSFEHPVRDRTVELHMLALHRDGRTAEALDVYRHARTRLADELGLDPSPALQRLHQAILRGEQLTPPRPTAAAAGIRPAQLPADVAGFVGRTNQLGQLDALLAAASADGVPVMVVTAIAGTAGVGKTTLAVHWAHRVRHRFPDGQLYVNLRGFDPCGTVLEPTEAVRGFLDALDVPAQRIPATPDARINVYRSLLAGKRMLVVLDNARDADQVRPLLPAAPGCLVLITSRNRLTSLVATNGAHPLTLDLPTAEESRDLLTRRLGAQRVAAEPRAIEDIITRCARLPLALAIVAAHAAAEPQIPLQVLADQLRDTRTTFETLRGGDAVTDVREVFSWSYRTLTPNGARLFRLLGLHPGPDVSAAAVASLTGCPPGQAQPLLAELTRSHLVTEHLPGRYTVHDLLRTYATDLAHTQESDAERHAAIRRVLDHYLHTAHRADRSLDLRPDAITPPPPRSGVTPESFTSYGQALSWFTAEHHVLLAAIRQGADTGFDTHTWQLAWTLARFLDWHGHWQDRATTQQAALDAVRRLGDRPAQASVHRILGHTHTQLGHHDQAHTAYTQALDLFDEIGDRDGQARTHLGIAILLEKQRRYSEALHHSRQSLDLYRTTGHRAGHAGALSLTGWYHALLGEHQQALTCCQQALPVHQELHLRRGEAATWDTLGCAHQHLGDHQQALTCYRHALVLYRDVEDRYYLADTLTHLGNAHHAAEETTQARDAWRQALTILHELDHPDAESIRTKLHDLDHS